MGALCLAEKPHRGAAPLHAQGRAPRPRPGAAQPGHALRLPSLPRLRRVRGPAPVAPQDPRRGHPPRRRPPRPCQRRQAGARRHPRNRVHRAAAAGGARRPVPRDPHPIHAQGPAPPGRARPHRTRQGRAARPRLHLPAPCRAPHPVPRRPADPHAAHAGRRPRLDRAQHGLEPAQRRPVLAPRLPLAHLPVAQRPVPGARAGRHRVRRPAARWQRRRQPRRLQRLRRPTFAGRQRRVRGQAAASHRATRAGVRAPAQGHDAVGRGQAAPGQTHRPGHANRADRRPRRPGAPGHRSRAALRRVAQPAAAPRQLPLAAGRAHRGAQAPAAPAGPGPLVDALPAAPPWRDRRAGRPAPDGRPLRRQGLPRRTRRAPQRLGARRPGRRRSPDGHAAPRPPRRGVSHPGARRRRHAQRRAGRRRPLAAGRHHAGHHAALGLARAATAPRQTGPLRRRPRAAFRRHRLRQAGRQGTGLRIRPGRRLRLRRQAGLPRAGRRPRHPQPHRRLPAVRAQAHHLADAAHLGGRALRHRHRPAPQWQLGPAGDVLPLVRRLPAPARQQHRLDLGAPGPDAGALVRW